MTDSELFEGLAMRLRLARVARGLKQYWVADRVGIHPVYLSRIETGKQSPSLRTLVKLSDLYVTSIDDLLGR